MSKIVLTEASRRYVREILWDRKPAALFDRRVVREGSDEIRLFQEPLYDLVAAHEHRDRSEERSAYVWNRPMKSCPCDPRSAYFSLSREQLNSAHSQIESDDTGIAIVLSRSSARYLKHTMLWDIERKAYRLALSLADDAEHDPTKDDLSDKFAADLAEAVAVYEQLTKSKFDPNLLDDWGNSDVTDGPKTAYKIDATVVELVRSHFHLIMHNVRTGKEDKYLCGQLGYCLKRASEALFTMPSNMTPRWWIEYVNPIYLDWGRRDWPSIFDENDSSYLQQMMMSEPPEVESWEELSLSPIALEGLLWLLNSMRPCLDNKEQELRVFYTLSELWNEPAFLNTLPEHRSLGRIRGEMLARMDDEDE